MNTGIVVAGLEHELRAWTRGKSLERFGERRNGRVNAKKAALDRLDQSKNGAAIKSAK